MLISTRISSDDIHDSSFYRRTYFEICANLEGLLFQNISVTEESNPAQVLDMGLMKFFTDNKIAHLNAAGSPGRRGVAWSQEIVMILY